MSELNSGQWCLLHDIHQDDPAHSYMYPECERVEHREATEAENAHVDQLLFGQPSEIANPGPMAPLVSPSFVDMTDEPPPDDTGPVIFGDDLVTMIEGVLPTMKVNLQKSYKRGHRIRMYVDVRVKSFRHGPRGKDERDFVMTHILELIEVIPITDFPEEAAVDDVGGSASAQAVPTAAQNAELGLTVGRTGETWRNPGSGSIVTDPGF